MLKQIQTNYEQFPSLLGDYHYFDHYLDGAFFRLSNSYESRLKLSETDCCYELSLQLPGYSSKEVEVSVKDYVLRVEAKNEKFGETLREITLWDGIDFDKVSGKIENGILSVQLPKIENIKPKKIKIE
jgi:HSP20 family molecular chaperone IbpA